MKGDSLRFDYNFVKEYIEDQGYFLLETEYINCDTKMKMKCDKGHIFDMSFYNFKNKGCRCPECNNVKRKTPYNEIKEELKQNGYELLTEEKDFKGRAKRFTVKCKNRHLQNTSFNSLKRNNFNCPECIRQEKYNIVLKLLEDKKYTIITKFEDFKYYDSYIEYYCDAGHYNRTKALYLFKIKGCQECANKRLAEKTRFSYEYVKNYIESFGYTLISKEYVNNSKRLKMICNKGHICYISFGNFKNGKRCRQCYKDSMKGENHPMWKGGISSINNMLRLETLKEWKIDSLKQNDYKCLLTNKHTDSIKIHHINKSFKDIVYECLKELNLDNVNLLKDVSQEQLDLLKKLNIEKHYYYGLGLPIQRQLHEKFHGLYSNINNTPQQFLEFVERLKSGEFDEFLKDNKLVLNIQEDKINKLIKCFQKEVA